MARGPRTGLFSSQIEYVFEKTGKLKAYMFSAHRNKPSSTDSSNEAPTESVLDPAPKVTFHLGTSAAASGDEDDDNEMINNNNNYQMTTMTMLCVRGHATSTKRRGSAPCTLLLNQIQKIASSAAKAATTASREHSPRGGCSLRNCRRGSLPSDLVSLGHSRSHSRSSR